jgi:hypothetical protein
MLRRSFCCRYGWGRTNEPQVLGASVPVFSNYPHRARDALVLYREFWRIVMLHPPHEQPDLAVRLRNEFRRGRLMRGENRINRAIFKAESQLNTFRTLVDNKQSRFDGRCIALLKPAYYRTGAFLSRKKKDDEEIDARRSKTRQMQMQQSQQADTRPRPPRTMMLQARSVDSAWQQLQSQAAGAVPNLPELRRSRSMSRRAPSPIFSANSAR